MSSRDRSAPHAMSWPSSKTAATFRLVVGASAMSGSCPRGSSRRRARSLRAEGGVPGNARGPRPSPLEVKPQRLRGRLLTGAYRHEVWRSIRLISAAAQAPGFPRSSRIGRGIGWPHVAVTHVLSRLSGFESLPIHRIRASCTRRPIHNLGATPPGGLRFAT